ncbi:MAG: 50S ribosomal protein L9 [Flavobacteriales bacterium]|nr:50S ribosomal protein L9 [Flavobacteriales bacterium]
MKLILKEDVKKLGYRNDVVDVKPGYGRNYLIPQGAAILATPSALKMLEEEIRQNQAKELQRLEDAKVLAEKLTGTTLKIATKAGSNGRIFGSVTTIQIAQSLKDLGFDIDRKKIDINEDIKELGQYKATIDLHKEVKVDIDLDVFHED